MAMKPEAGLYKRLKENLQDAHITRIESRVNLGIPDCLIALNNNRFIMVELKVVKRGKKINLSPHQVSFHLKHASIKCPTFILVQYHPAGTTTFLKAELLLYKGGQAEELIHLGITAQPCARWPLSHVQWHMLRYALTE